MLRNRVRSSPTVVAGGLDASSLAARFRRVRATTETLCRPLATDDYSIQSMPDASPAKWHLAHTTWFFEEFVLQHSLAGYEFFDPAYRYLFNSYYEAVGPRHARAERGMLSRPTIEQIWAYRAYVDEEMQSLLDSDALLPEMHAVVTLGLHHEQQHQELLLTDIKHLFSRNPLRPAYAAAAAPASRSPAPLAFVEFDGGLVEAGYIGGGFCFDNEQPRHRVFLEPFRIANRLTTNGEYLEFIRAGGYDRPDVWLSDGWAWVQREQCRRPLYWSDSLDEEFTLAGPRPLDPHAPVCHLSFYEADAFARWAGARLPTEFEWEHVAAQAPLRGCFLEAGTWHPVAAAEQEEGSRNPAPVRQLFGDVWEWTASAYAPYPGFRPLSGALGEYNGKFMVNQLVLRGGSCATPQSHIRVTYRNFFYPTARWQFSGLRLAADVR
ncbi:MAG: ergothioneine biosynthesis protein EgtB [Steroidobacteraceae bacterium]|nr:ergothioneine biosynthesis protein EgtB [Steroidobacteraceae bacterium]